MYKIENIAEKKCTDNISDGSSVTAFPSKIGKMISEVPHHTDNVTNVDFKKRAFALNYVSDPVFQYDNKVQIIWANKAALELSDLTSKQVIGKTCCQVCVGFSCKMENCPVRNAFKTSAHQTAKIETPDNGTYQISALPFVNFASQVESVIQIIKQESANCVTNKSFQDAHPDVTAFADKISQLTEREHQVMSLVVNGKSNKNIADELCLSPKTVEIHRSKVMSKLKADSLASLVRSFTLFEFHNA